MAPPRLPVRSTLNNSCFPVKYSGLVGSHWILGLWISNLIHKFSLMNFHARGSKELKPPQVPGNRDSWVFWGFLNLGG